MFLEMDCSCGASIQIDSEWEESVWLMAHRFSDAHVKCEMFAPPGQDLPLKPEHLVGAEDEEFVCEHGCHGICDDPCGECWTDVEPVEAPAAAPDTTD